MTQSELNPAVLDHNRRNLKKLAWAVAASQEEFKLIIVRCNYSKLQALLLEQLQLEYPRLHLFQLESSDTALYNLLRRQLGDRQPQGVCVLGLEKVNDLDHLLASLNQVREELRQNLCFPLIVWVTDQGLLDLKQNATDLESWATKIRFNLPPEVLRNSLQQGANQLFTSALSMDFDRVSVILSSVDEIGELRRGEVEAALQDLEEQDHTFGLTLEANLQFAQGLIALDDPAKTVIEANHSALEHFQKSLEFWQAQSSSPLSQDNALAQDKGENLSTLRAGLLSFYIGRCHYLIADEESPNDDTKLAKQYLDQAIFIFEQANRLDLVGYCLPQLGRAIRRTVVDHLEGSENGQAWQDLEALAQRGIQLNKTFNYPWGLVHYYGFLVDIALNYKRWSDAKDFATIALQEFEKVTEEQQWAQSLFLLLLARAEQGLGDSEKAIEHLKLAQELGVQGHPRIYIKVLNTLQEIYFDQGEKSLQNQVYFLEAFRTKLERLSIEQQYGFRAFVGAGRIQPDQRNMLAGYAKNQVDKPGQVAAEMQVSRRRETKDLIQRMREPAYKLVVIHGLSGVGKSSLIDAAFLPTLKNSTSGIQDYLPILIRRYDNWVKNLAHELLQSLKDKGIEPIIELVSELEKNTTEIIAKSARNLPSNRLINAIYRQLEDIDRQNDRYHLQTIIIFDQFEEIFVLNLNADAQRNLKQQFFSFLSDCLNLTYLKIVLSLREDYLHFLLEGSRLAQRRKKESDGLGVLGTNIMGDILSQDKLYFIGNFSLDEATNIIRRLTVRAGSQLPDDLIAQLVADLSVEIGEVRPIELQVVGSVLQERNISTLLGYQKLGDNPKEILVGDFLDQVLKDCGSNNEEIAKLMLYLLTGDKEIRPRKTLHELAQDPNLKTFDENRLRLILDILVESRLVLMLPETPEDRYQLVHDYLATLVRSKVDPAQIEIKKKEQEIDSLRRNRKRWVRFSIFNSGLGIVFLCIGGLAFREARNAIVSNVRAAVTQAQFYQDSGDQMEALVTSYDANPSLQRNVLFKFFLSPEIKLLADGQLLQIFQRLQEANNFKAHQSAILDIAISEDGLIATAGADADKVIRLWRNTQGVYKSVSIFPGHTGRINSISLSSKCNILASASDDGKVILWALGSGNIVNKEIEGSRSVRSVSISPNGRWMLTGDDDGKVEFWELFCSDYSNEELGSGSSSAENNLQNTTLSPKLPLRLIAERRNSVQSSRGSGIRDIKFHPDSDLVAVSSFDNVIRLWNPSNGKLVKEIKGCDYEVVSRSTCRPGEFSALSFNFDGTILASGGTTNRVYLWKRNGQNYESYSNFNPLEQEGRVEGLSFSRKRETTLLAVAVNPSMMKIWDIGPDPLGSSIQLQNVDVRNIRAIEFDRNNHLFSGLSSGVLKEWQVQPDLRALRDKAYIIDDFPVKDFSLSATGRIIAAIEDSKSGPNPQAPKEARLKVWNLKELGKPTELGTISVPGTASKIAISPDNRTIALLVDNDNQGSPIKKVLCWNFQEKTQPPVECFPRAFGMIEQIEFSPNGKYLALVEINEKAICEPKLPSLSGNLNLQSMNQSGEQSGVGELKIGQIHLLSMDGKSNDKDNISIVDKCGLDEAGENLFQNTPTISSIKFHPDSTYLAISVGKDVRFYDLKKNDFKESSTRIGHTESVNDLDFSIDGKYLATASDDNTSRILEFRSLFNNRRPTDTASDDNTIKAKVLRIFSKKKSAGGDQDKRNDSSILGHEDRVKRVTFGQGKANFFTIDSKGMISLWSVEGDITHPLVEFPIPSFYFDSPNDPAIVIASAKFSKSEGLFAFVGQGGRLFLWEIDPEAIEERICHGYQKNKAAEAQVDKFENSPYIAWDKRCNP